MSSYRSYKKTRSYPSIIRTGYNLGKQRSLRQNAYATSRLARVGVSGSVLATRGFRPGFGTLGGNRFDLRHEKKVSDIATATYQVNTTGSFTLLHIPTQGTDYTNRIGRKTMMKSVYIRGRVQLEDAGTLAAVVNSYAQQGRFILFLDLQPNGAVPVVTDLLNTADPASQLNLNNRDRFKIIKDKCFVFDPIAVSTVTTPAGFLNRTVYNFKVFKKCSIETIFSTNGGTIADITTGALYMFWIGSQAGGTNTDTNAVVSTRVRYMDD